MILTCENIPELSGTLQTGITTADGEPMILFHSEPITPEEIAEFEALTYNEISAIMKQLGFNMRKLH